MRYLLCIPVCFVLACHDTQQHTQQHTQSDQVLQIFAPGLRVGQPTEEAQRHVSGLSRRGYAGYYGRIPRPWAGFDSVLITAEPGKTAQEIKEIRNLTMWSSAVDSLPAVRDTISAIVGSTEAGGRRDRLCIDGGEHVAGTEREENIRDAIRPGQSTFVVFF